jgi:hypothetical protein
MKSTEGQKMQGDAGQESSWSGAAKLGRKIRELAYRSNRALKEDSHTPVDSPSGVRDLDDLNDQITRLKQKIHDRRLEGLIPWVDALKRQVDDRLNDMRKAGAQWGAKHPKSGQ